MSEHVIPRTRVARIYNLAARLLREHGWIQNESMRRNSAGEITGFCISGAVDHATHMLGADAYQNAANNLLNDLTPRHDFVAFNDWHETTIDDVLVLLHKAQDQVLTGGFEVPDYEGEGEL